MNSKGTESKSILTARDIYQVTDLLKFFDLPCR